MAISSGRPTMNDVASHAGVSLKTVSRVVNNVSTVDPALTERVLSSIRALGFRRNGMAASLRSGTGIKTIGLVTADLSNAFYTTLSSSIAAVARERGFQVIMTSSEEQPELEESLALDLCQRQVTGLLVVPTTSDHSYLTPEMDLGIPVVFVDRPGNGVDADAILIDNRGGARSAVQRLLESGHRRIGTVMDSLSIYSIRERMRGVEDALETAGIRDRPKGLIAADVHSPDEARHAVAAMMALDDPPTAIFCGNNRSTIGTVEELWRQGSQIEVTGFDDFEMSRLLPLSVTIVDYDASRLGALAAERLFARIEDATLPTLDRFLPTRLITRGGNWGTGQK